MPRILFLVLLFTLAFNMRANSPFTGDEPARKRVNEVEAFFNTKSLSLDSASTPYLYYKIFEWLGTKYAYAGETKKGIDCSGFVSEMYQHVYCIKLSGGSRDIFPVTSPLEKGELKEGDLVFFKIKKGQISHVGIYLGNNKFAHASVNSGVIVSDLDEEYYKRYFYKGGRIIAAS